jgi:hypothetical protein
VENQKLTPSKKARMSKSKIKVCLSFSSIQKEFFCKSAFYMAKPFINTVALQFWNVYESGFGKKKHMWHNSWWLHHDNAPAHSAFRGKQFLAKKNITVLEHPHYLPHLAPSDCFLFP